MAIQINTLFRITATGRLRYVNEPGPDESCPPAPRFFMGRTHEGNLWRFHADLPPAAKYQGPAYWIATDPPAAASAVLLTPDNLELLRANFPDWLQPPPIVTWDRPRSP